MHIPLHDTCKEKMPYWATILKWFKSTDTLFWQGTHHNLDHVKQNAIFCRYSGIKSMIDNEKTIFLESTQSAVQVSQQKLD
jgi:hypothetical protein